MIRNVPQTSSPMWRRVLRADRSAAPAKTPDAGVVPAAAGGGAAEKPTPPNAVRVDLIKHEYTAVKTEMSAAVAAQQTVMAYSLAAAAAIFTGLLASWKDVAIRIAVLSLAPLFLHLTWFVWLGELIRMARAARFLWELEKKVNSWRVPPAPVAGQTGSDLPGDRLLHWEGWVRGENRWNRNLHLGPSYALASTAIIGMAVISEVLAVIFALTETVHTALKIMTFASLILFVALACLGASIVATNPVLRRGMSR